MRVELDLTHLGRFEAGQRVRDPVEGRSGAVTFVGRLPYVEEPGIMVLWDDSNRETSISWNERFGLAIGRLEVLG